MIEIISYIDFKTIVCLFCLMVAIDGIEMCGTLESITTNMASRVGTSRSLYVVLVAIPFFSSMVVTNDVALLMCVPVAIAICHKLGIGHHTAHIVVLQTVAANIGSSLTPMGNPQNLYLFTYYDLGVEELFEIVWPYVLVGLVGLIIASIARRPVAFDNAKIVRATIAISPKLVINLVLLIVAILGVVQVIDYRLALIIVTVSALIVQPRVLLKINWKLLILFIVLFILVGFITRIEAIDSFIGSMADNNTLLAAVVTSQFVSNVPAAVLISPYTVDFVSLLIGVCIGGMGTLIASMASLISYSFYAKYDRAGRGRFLKIFTAYNVAFLFALLMFAWIDFKL